MPELPPSRELEPDDPELEPEPLELDAPELELDEPEDEVDEPEPDVDPDAPELELAPPELDVDEPEPEPEPCPELDADCPASPLSELLVEPGDDEHAARAATNAGGRTRLRICTGILTTQHNASSSGLPTWGFSFPGRARTRRAVGRRLRGGLVDGDGNTYRTGGAGPASHLV
jgi:hypothetical protein